MRQGGGGNLVTGKYPWSEGSGALGPTEGFEIRLAQAGNRAGFDDIAKVSLLLELSAMAGSLGSYRIFAGQPPWIKLDNGVPFPALRAVAGRKDNSAVLGSEELLDGGESFLAGGSGGESQDG